VIRFKNVSKIYKSENREIKALENINFQIQKGEIVLLKGVSGSGKSTILSLIAGITKPTSGDIIVNGKRVSKLQDRFSSKFRQETIGFIFQKFNLIPNISAFDNIVVPIIPLNLESKEIEKDVKKLLKKFNLEHRRDILVKNLSGGEQQRVAIARALINNPEIIIADEPTANLDRKLSLDFIEILKSLKDKTVIIATHDPIFFDLDIINRVIEIENGRVRGVGLE
jgi:putative ABC transport system ATP-binding protein